MNQPRADVRFLKDLETWVALGADKQTVLLLRKADAALDAELLQKWCQVITRGKLDESGQFGKFDEATWEQARLELTHLLDANPNSQSLRSAVTDSLYWLRQEIKDSSAPLPLLDRLVAAEPNWPNYSQRSAAHANLGHWDLAIRDELEAGRLAGNRYWLRHSDWTLGGRLVQAPGHPREHYELALRWTEARIRAGINDERALFLVGYAEKVTNGLALFRLGRYSDALATLRKRDVRKLTHVAGMLMSPWNVLYYYPAQPPGNFGSATPPLTMDLFTFDPVDLTVRAMCHHHLGQPQEAGASLQQVRRLVGKDSTPEQRALLSEAEALIERKLP